MAFATCTTENYDICIDKFRCCLGPEQLYTIIAYLVAEQLTRYGTTAQDILAQYTAIPAMRDPREFLSALVCIIANEVGDDHTGLELWQSAQVAGFNKLSPTDRNRIIIAGLCVLLNPPQQ